MSGNDIEIWMYHRPVPGQTLAARHAEVMQKMQRLTSPFRVTEGNTPPTPQFGSDVVAGSKIKYPIRGLKNLATYNYGYENGKFENSKRDDDVLRFGFNIKNKEIDYDCLIKEWLPELTIAFDSYRMFLERGLHSVKYCGGINDTNEIYNQLNADKSINIDGRNNIFTLYPAQFWDAELCRLALGYGPDEVVRRLDGKIPVARIVGNGVYLLLTEQTEQTYEEFKAMNDQAKAILGLR